MKACPYCYTENDNENSQCTLCGNDITKYGLHNYYTQKARKTSIKRLTVTSIITVIIIVCLAFTNPSTDNYTKWILNEAVKTNNSNISKVFIYLVGDNIIQSLTTTENYLVFTIFDTDMGGEYKIKTLGIFNHFFIMYYNDKQ